MHYKSNVAIASIAIFAPSLIFSGLIFLRKSFGAQSGWAFLCLFCFLRIVGGSLQLATESSGNGHNQHLFSGAAICDAIGMGPLLLATTSLLSQCNGFLHAKAVPNQIHRALATFAMCIVVATVIAIVGGIQSFSAKNIHDGFSSNDTFRAAVCLFTAAYVSIAGSATVIAARAATLCGPPAVVFRFKCTVSGIVMALVLLLIHLLYSLFVTFDKNPKLPSFGENETIELCMQVIEEWLVVFIYLAIGLAMRNTFPPQRETMDKNHKSGQALKVLRYTPFVHWFIK